MSNNPIIELYKELSTKEYAVMMALIPFISYYDCILRYENKVLDGVKMCEILEDNYETFGRVITSLIKKNILCRIERVSNINTNRTKKYLAANPFIFMRGQTIDDDIMSKFKNSKWANLN